MKAISIREPYASDIISGRKTVEYRSWRTRIRGRILICASARPKGPTAGKAIGTVEVVDVTGYPGDYEWHLANPKRLRKPFPVRGRLNFFEVELP